MLYRRSHQLSVLDIVLIVHCRKKWQPTPMFLPGESLGEVEPGGVTKSRT